MKEEDDANIRELLKQSLPPAGHELQRDLWPQMLRRLDDQPQAVPWFDWALLALALAWLLISPATIPVLLYQL